MNERYNNYPYILSLDDIEKEIKPYANRLNAQTSILLDIANSMEYLQDQIDIHRVNYDNVKTMRNKEWGNR